ncbi:MAG: hypothetical protein JOZ20_07720 [Sphingomonas sp.]|nr:hypothetical protein [Sphingomonas sp.]MBW0007187.1 hypothetical protein [Sphingomonas sp.]
MSELRALVAEELSLPVDQRVSACAAAIAEKHGAASRSVLFYGSCLRQKQLDGLMLDFYLIVSDYRAAYAKRWLAVANRLIPPNVFYFEHDGLVAKYAVLSEADFEHECSRQAWTVSTAARFAQPSRLVWSRDRFAAKRTIDAVSQAAPTLLDWTLPSGGGATIVALDLWRRAFALTFKAELRAEREDRSAKIVEADPDRYAMFGEASLKEIARYHGVGPNGEVSLWKRPDRAARWWRGKQSKGKLYSVARLAKASLTFAGGAEYVAWKINRHAGADIQLKPWQRRHPLLAGISLLPRLLRSGAVR